MTLSPHQAASQSAMEDFFWDARPIATSIPTGTPTQVLGRNGQRRKLIIQNLDAANAIELVRNQSDAAGVGIRIVASSVYVDDAPGCFRGEVWLVAVTAAVNVRVREEFVATS